MSHSFSWICYIIGMMHFKVNLTISYIFSYWWLLHFYDWVASWKPRQETMQLFSKISKEPSSKTERWVIKRLCVLEKHQVCFFHSTKREKIDEFYRTSIKKVKFRYCEKATKFEKNHLPFLKALIKQSGIFVAFSEYWNFQSVCKNGSNEI